MGGLGMEVFKVLSEEIDECIKECIQDVISIRRYIHANPELSLKEYKTSELVYEELNTKQC